MRNSKDNKGQIFKGKVLSLPGKFLHYSIILVITEASIKKKKKKIDFLFRFHEVDLDITLFERLSNINIG